MKEGYKKYLPFKGLDLKNRQWPNKTIDKAPVWCSVDLRDGNQALVNPMNLDEKLLFFNTLVETGIKEIEVGFPASSDTEYEILRTLIEKDLIPEDVTIQVLVQAREHLIRRTFEGIRGAKNVILHLYNSVSTLQRKVVFGTDMQGVIDIAVKGGTLVYELAQQLKQEEDINITFEYSPESFSGTEPENAVLICEKMMEVFRATPEHKVILNLPNTVEMCTPNTYADQIEYFCTHIKNRDSAIISIHPHNDRGTATAATELGLMAGAQRVEGTFFGNGERTGNCDIMNVALNMYSQGVDPGLNFSNLNYLKQVYEQCTKMHIHERHPYAGELVFTAFSGSHQDAINKGTAYMEAHESDYWEVPYLPIDPADIGRQYEPIIRINSQSGKGGAAFVMHQNFGFDLPKWMHAEFGAVVKAACDKEKREITPGEVFDLFKSEYIDVKDPCHLGKYRIFEERVSDNEIESSFDGVIEYKGESKKITGRGNGPIDAFFSALHTVGFENYDFLSYSEHAISGGSDSKAVSYIRLRHKEKEIYGVGIDNNISVASIKGILCAINRQRKRGAKASPHE